VEKSSSNRDGNKVKIFQDSSRFSRRDTVAKKELKLTQFSVANDLHTNQDGIRGKFDKNDYFPFIFLMKNEWTIAKRNGR
jgi:hypothetical protein